MKKRRRRLKQLMSLTLACVLVFGLAPGNSRAVYAEEMDVSVEADADEPQSGPGTETVSEDQTEEGTGLGTETEAKMETEPEQEAEPSEDTEEEPETEPVEETEEEPETEPVEETGEEPETELVEDTEEEPETEPVEETEEEPETEPMEETELQMETEAVEAGCEMVLDPIEISEPVLLADEDTIILTSWDDSVVKMSSTGTSKYIEVAAGKTLDLSQVADSPEIETWIYIMGDGVRIIGNPDVTFQDVQFQFDNSKTNSSAYSEKDITLTLENYHTKTKNMQMIRHFDSSYPQPDSLTIQYEGANAFCDLFSLSVNATYDGTIIYRGMSGATLELTSGAYGNSSSAGSTVNTKVVFDGGKVTSNAIRVYSATEQGGIEIKNCDLTISDGLQGIYQSSVANSGEPYGGTTTITNSTVKVEINDTNPLSNNPGGICGGKRITIDNSVVSVYCDSNRITAIGNADEIKIENNSDVTVISNISEIKNSNGVCDGGIGGTFDRITISDSTVNAQACYGAGIGKRGQNTGSTSRYPDTLYGSDSIQSIIIQNSTVTASSTYGAGIGSGWAFSSSQSESNITISGDSKVTARSLYGAGIGAGVTGSPSSLPGVEIELNPGVGGGWDSDSDVEIDTGSADEAGAKMSVSAFSLTRAAGTNTLAPNNGVLTIETTDGKAPEISAESGTKAVSLVVKAATPMMEYTLNEAPTVMTPVNRQILGGSISSYDLRPGFRSLAFWPVSEGTYALTYGSGGDPDPLLDLANNLADTYSVTLSESDALNHFDVIPQRKLGGTVVLAGAADGSASVNTRLTANLAGLTPDGAGTVVSYQWYRNGEEISGAFQSSYTPVEEGVYRCTVTGVGLYRGTLDSAAVTVVNGSLNVPAAPRLDTAGNDSITLKAPDDGENYEYSIDGGRTWQDSTVFTGLKRATAYSFVQRVKAEDDNPAGPVSAASAFSTKGGAPGADSITYNYTDEKIQIPNGITVYTDENYTNTISNGKIITSYIGKPLYLVYTDEAAKNETTVTAIMVPSRPDAPELKTEFFDIQAASITLPSEQGVEYALFSENNTSDVPDRIITGTGSDITFTGLSSNAKYILKSRLPAEEDPNGHFHSLQRTFSFTTLEYNKKAIVLKPAQLTFTYDSQPHSLTFTTDPVKLDGITVKYYQNGDWTTATENPPVEAGVYSAWVHREAEGEYAAYDRTFTMEITKSDLSECEVKISPDSFVYDGTEKTPSVTVKLGDAVINPNEYHISYSRSDGIDGRKDAGMITITVTAKENGNCTGSNTGSFEIKPMDMKDAETVLGGMLIANGEIQTQAIQSVTVKDSEGKPLEATYTVVGNTGKEPGVYTMTMTGTGNFTGELTKSFVIMPAEESQLNTDSKGNVIIGKGSICLKVQQENGAPAVEIRTSTAAIVEMMIRSGDLTADDLSCIADGAELDVILKVKDISNLISAGSKEQFREATGNHTVGQYLSMDLYKLLLHNGQTGERTVLTGIHESISLALKIPGRLLNTDDRIVRTFWIARNYQGTVEFLSASYDKEENALIFETDRCAEYAIIYQDKNKEVSPSGKPGNESGGKSNDRSGSESGKGADSVSNNMAIGTPPPTGDSTDLGMWLALLFLSCGSVIASFLYGKRQKKTE